MPPLPQQWPTSALKRGMFAGDTQVTFQLSGGDFYEIMSCWLPGNFNDPYCVQAHTFSRALVHTRGT
jgi:hypothetical protein